MKKIVYFTLIVFIAILIIVAVIASNNAPRTVTYKNGIITEDH